MSFSRSRFSAVVLLLAVTSLPGCGKKAALIPPQKLVPTAITDLRYSLDENGVTLEWTYPVKMENGGPLQSIESFLVVRAVVPEEQYCEGCPQRFEEPVEIGGGQLPATGAAKTGMYTDTYLQEGYRYLYRVRSRAGGWYASRDSNEVSFTWSSPPEAVQGLQLKTGDRSLALRWEPVTLDVAGKPLRQTPQYQVYRKGGEAGFLALSEPGPETGFLDVGLTNGVGYLYEVRALVKYADTLQAGPASQVISGVPRDLTPPGQPQHLVAVRVPAGVKLVWQAVMEDDSAGYRVYRRAADSVKPELIAELGRAQNQYVDHDRTTGGRWYYSVTAFDRAEPPNESMPAAEALIELD